MMYDISEIYTDVVQGEGLHAGVPCSVLRFGRCNLWPDADKPSATCPWCDTEVLHRHSQYTFEHLVGTLQLLAEARPHHGLIITGGEPLMQLNTELLDTLAGIFPWIDIETNGTLPFNIAQPPNAFISCSPKSAKIALQRADWYKVLIPDKEFLLQKVLELARSQSAAVYLQPVETGGYSSDVTQQNIRKCIELCNKLGTVRLSLQIHKIIGVR